MKRLTWVLIGAMALAAGCGPNTNAIRKEGISDFQVGRIDQAEQRLNEVLAQRPSDPEALYYMGRIHYSRGQYDQAAYYFASSLDADPRQKKAAEWLKKTRAEAGIPAYPIVD